MRAPPLSVALLPGAAYFFAVALAHTLGVHVPGAYIFFDVPSTAFQDQIIGLLAFGWGVHFLGAAQRCRQDSRAPVTGLLVSGFVALAALVRIAACGDFPALAAQPRAWAHWLQIGALAAYLVVLLVLERRRHGSVAA